MKENTVNDSEHYDLSDFYPEVAWDEDTDEHADPEPPPRPLPKYWTLYRVFGSDGTLLYIGCTSSPYRRYQEHRYSAPWWAEMRSWVEGETFASRRLALLAEAAAILRERPRYNKVHNPSREHS